jgi:hypothetical protein
MSRHLALAIASVVILSASTASADITYSPSEAATVRGYVLTEDKVQRFISAMDAIKAAQGANSALRKEAQGNAGAVSLTALMARAKSKPATMAYFTKAGLSTTDAVLIPAAIVDAEFNIAAPATAKAYPASAAQIVYVKAHAKQIEAFSKSGE